MENTMFLKRQIAACAILACCAAGASASAATLVWPASIVGTWNGTSNQTPIVLTITTQSAGGKCQAISGTVQNVGASYTEPMSGYYCPGSGALEFLRFPTNSPTAYQAYAGNLSQTPVPKHTTQMMAGVFGQYTPSYGPLGQFSFSVFK